MAACTSRAAASMDRSRSNWSTTLVAPRRLVEVISVTPAMRENCRSSGVATDEAIVSGLAPGKVACTWMTGNSTCGSGATGSMRYARRPASSSAMLSSEVATGRLMNGAERPTSVRRRFHDRATCRGDAPRAPTQTVEGEVHHRRRVEREHLREQEPADDGDAERLAQLRARPRPERQRHAAQQRGHRRHHDGPEAQQTRLVDGLLRRLALFALGVEGEVDHHDRVLL